MKGISHSSVERVMAPDANILLDFSLSRMNNIVANQLFIQKHEKFKFVK